ncbi:MAG: tripartite tricarboxylate transporter substrate-binding protein [Albidovulum sp.]|nr:tripartite tricarboxylate transporter substrate-binding protein [Albidovulum sp.]MDE0305435.1 tripartite tricarboxylate transporter substrate-binding protein [Albidovulum sp.]MDE0532307.1 tripartite tricarboxylate transporter substrate-binding protein [Albidovulum sp.]
MNLVSKISLGAAALGFAVLAAPVQAFEPVKPIDFVIMAGQGGGADRMARLMQSIVEQNDMAGRPLVPTNKSGGSGAEALLALKNATDKDHTIMVTLNSFFTTPLRQPGLEVDILSYAPIGRMAEDTFVLWVHKNEGINTFEEFVAEAKARGSDWVMGGTGSAQEDEIITNFLNGAFGLNMKYIPYSGGGAVARDLAGEQIDSSVNNPSEALGFYESGDVIPLVAFTDERLPFFPDVPTVREKGVQFAYYMQRSVVGAPGMSEEASAYYTDLFTRVFDSDEWQTYRNDKSLLGDFLSGENLMTYWEVQRERHETILKASGDIK